MDKALLSELVELASRHGTQEQIPNLKIPFLYIARYDAAMPPLHHLVEPTLSIMLQGHKRVVVEDEYLEYHPGEILINSIDLPITVHTSKGTKTRPVLAIGFVLNPSIIASLTLDSKKQKIDQAGIQVEQASINLLDAVLRLMKLLDHPEDIPVLSESLEREIHWRILQSQFGSIARQLSQKGSPTQQIANAIDWIRGNFNKTLRIEHLAELCAMSPTSLHRHFRLATLMSPVQYQKKIRLQEARVKLMSTKDDVASIGFSVGYESPSQFSREYRREFGVTPKIESQKTR